MSEKHNRMQSGKRRFASLVAALAVLAGSRLAGADPFPPEWNIGQPAAQNCGANGQACHFAPVPWPAEPENPAQCGSSCGEWKPYTRFQSGLADPRVQDPSNGGTAPQN